MDTIYQHTNWVVINCAESFSQNHQSPGFELIIDSSFETNGVSTVE